MSHSPGHHHHHHSHDVDWAAMASHLELQGDVLLPLVTETAADAAELSRRDGIEVRRVLDVGSGPGVATCELARQFGSAQVVAADGSAALLERAAARAAAAGFSGRVTIRQVELPDGIEELGPADLIWMAMVLHHVGDEAAMLRRLRRMLDPRGILILVEHGEPMRYLPEGAEPLTPGLIDRLAAADAAWLASHRAELPDATPSAGYPAMLAAAGFEVVIDRVAHVRLEPPLSPEGRQVVLGHLRRNREESGEGLNEQDRAALDILTDESHPLGITQRPDAYLDASRHVYVARAG